MEVFVAGFWRAPQPQILYPEPRIRKLHVSSLSKVSGSGRRRLSGTAAGLHGGVRRWRSAGGGFRRLRSAGGDTERG